jgi:hypothetical protein
VRIEIADGPTLDLETGDIASLPKGAETRWCSWQPVTKLPITPENVRRMIRAGRG